MIGGSGGLPEADPAYGLRSVNPLNYRYGRQESPHHMPESDENDSPTLANVSQCWEKFRCWPRSAGATRRTAQKRHSCSRSLRPHTMMVAPASGGLNYLDGHRLRMIAPGRPSPDQQTAIAKDITRPVDEARTSLKGGSSCPWALPS